MGKETNLVKVKQRPSMGDSGKKKSKKTKRPTDEELTNSIKKKLKKQAKKTEQLEDASSSDEQRKVVADEAEEQGQDDEQQEEEGSFDLDEDKKMTFEELGVHPELCKACDVLGWTHATPIQKETIPYALQGRDLIGLAETGSGKTGAFTIPILCSLLKEPSRRLYALILAPTRELAFQINEVVQGLGTCIGVKGICVVGGVDKVTQAIALAKKPHIVVGTPGRVVDHLENTKGFSIDRTKFLVLDEADRMLSMDFEEEINKVLQMLPPRNERQTFLFSATMTNKVAKLQRASLTNPVKCEVSKSKYQTVKTLVQNYVFVPARFKDTYLVYILNELSGQSGIIFVNTCHNALRLSHMLRLLGIQATALHGQMPQPKRLGALNNFKSKGNEILVATDVAARGLDIPFVDLVINYDVPTNGKDYIHRVGRTARAGRSGRSVTMITQYDIEIYQRIEAMLDQKLPEFPAPKDLVMILDEQVGEAARQAVNKIREDEANKKGPKKFKPKPKK